MKKLKIASLKWDNILKICFETIKVENGKLLNIKYHQQRVDYTRSFFGFTDKFELKKQILNLPQKGEFRLRIDYAKTLHVKNL